MKNNTKMKTYYFEDGVMRNYIKKEDITLEWSNFISPELQQKLYEIIKEKFSKKRNQGIKDTVIYNFIRNKPIFRGINVLRQDTFETRSYNFNYNKNNSFKRDDIGDVMEKEMITGGDIQYNKILSLIHNAFKDNFEKDTTPLKLFNTNTNTK